MVDQHLSTLYPVTGTINTLPMDTAVSAAVSKDTFDIVASPQHPEPSSLFNTGRLRRLRSSLFI